MAGGSTPGSKGKSRSHPIDKGTMALMRMVDRHHLGSEEDKLVVDPTLLNSQTLFRSTIHEALERGAGSVELGILRQKYLWMRHTERSEVAPAAEAFDDPEDLWAELVIDEERTRFDSIIKQEMKQISDGTAKGKLDPKDAGPVSDSTDYQYNIRPFYYAHGYSHPADFLSQQVEFMMFGKPKLKTWMHKDLAAILARTPAVLDGWNAGLADKTAKDVGSANGLQIRVVKGSKNLSNHSFGLAVDLNALANPHVVGPDVIAVFNSVVKEAGVTFDFGKPVLGPHAMEVAASASSVGAHKTYTADDIMEMQNRAIPASDAIKVWLQANLPRYRQIMAQIQISEKQLGIKNVKPNTPLKQRFKAAEAARNQWAKKEEEKLKKQRGGLVPVYGSDNPPPPEPSYAEEEAFEEIELAMQSITGDRDLSRIQTLYENFEPDYINTWEKQGVMSIPLYLAVALVVKQHLRWGEQYEQSKDGMHFELVRDDGGPVIPPDAKDAELRTLKQLMDDAFSAKTPKFHF
ncbi:MAG TPA: M15 family metallopeptidase [Candidatus Sulfotelmatobacter sp.]|jgi:hypothetical protein|nr:M15 family metallopeptidase [Candidatus Sulfotelmatobacter sp.]